MSYHADLSALYASAFDDKAFGAALCGLQQHVHSSFLHVLAFDTESGSPVDGIGSGASDVDRIYREEWAARDVRVPRGLAAPRNQIWHQSQLFSDGERKTSPIYNEWLRQHDAQHGIGIMTAVSPATVVCTTAFRPERQGAYSGAETALWYDTHRHVMTIMGLREQYLKAHLSAPPAVNLQTAAIYLGKTGRVLHATPAAEALVGAASGIDILRGRVKLASVSQTAHLEGKYQSVLDGHACQPMRLRGEGSGTILVLTVVPAVAPPLALIGADWPHLTLFLRVLTPAVTLDPATVAEVFGLTPTEAAIACAVADGATAAQIATRRGRALSTVRWTIRNILEKLEVQRQSDLRVLFSGLL